VEDRLVCYFPALNRGLRFPEGLFQEGYFSLLAAGFSSTVRIKMQLSEKSTTFFMTLSSFLRLVAAIISPPRERFGQLSGLFSGFAALAKAKNDPVRD